MMLDIPLFFARGQKDSSQLIIFVNVLEEGVVVYTNLKQARGYSFSLN